MSLNTCSSKNSFFQFWVAKSSYSLLRDSVSRRANGNENSSLIKEKENCLFQCSVNWAKIISKLKTIEKKIFKTNQSNSKHRLWNTISHSQKMAYAVSSRAVNRAEMILKNSLFSLDWSFEKEPLKSTIWFFILKSAKRSLSLNKSEKSNDELKNRKLSEPYFDSDKNAEKKREAIKDDWKKSHLKPTEHYMRR